jgi:hypothetical protein
VLDTERQLFSAEIDLAAITRDQLNAVVQVYKALGGGWEADFPPGRKAQTMTEQLEETKKETREPVPPVIDQGNGGSMDSVPELPPVSKSYRRPVKLALIALAILVGATVGIRYYLYARAHESTDDAFIAGHTTPINPKVASYVSRVYIDDNQHVNSSAAWIKTSLGDSQSVSDFKDPEKIKGTARVHGAAFTFDCHANF